jgi:IS5 family transposase
VTVTNWLAVDRTGTTVDSIAMTATAISMDATNVQVNGSEVCRDDGTGCSAAGSDTQIQYNKQLEQLEKNKIIVKTGAIVDASIVDSPLKPKGQTTFEIENDRSEEERSDEDKNNENTHHSTVTKTQKGADPEGRWIKKSGVTRFGYKKHTVTDEEGLILGILTTPANVNEISNLEEVLDTADLPEGIHLNADKGYASAKNEELLEARKIKSRILHRARKGKPLTEREKLRNKLIGKTRFKIERTFGSIKRWFNSTHTRYKGMAKTHTQNLIEAIAYNLYRAPGIVASNSFKMSK